MQRKYEATLILPAALSTGRLHFQIAKQHTKEKTDNKNPWSYWRTWWQREMKKLKKIPYTPFHHFEPKSPKHWLLEYPPPKEKKKKKGGAWYNPRKNCPQQRCYNKLSIYTAQEH